MKRRQIFKIQKKLTDTPSNDNLKKENSNFIFQNKNGYGLYDFITEKSNNNNNYN